ncbi:MAG: glycosyltransferase family 4 protein, partial [Acidobacteriaceae bacterium]|nr:glycosyltransferase family 4 protein [Acidobacteriaceae bacterium]
IVWEQTALPRASRKLRLNVLFNPGFTAPAWRACPNVTVFHDLQHKRHPEYFRWLDLPFWRLLLWTAVRRSCRLIAVSNSTQRDLERFYGAASTVIHHGVEKAFFEIAQQREPGDYLLCVSTLHPHKNLERLLRVHAESPALPDLVITGLRGFAAKELETRAGPRVRFTGWVPRADLYHLFRRAAAFVYPSRFEGFGLPVLEAMAAGVPVACSDIPPLREIADGCAQFFAPDDDQALYRALRSVTHDLSFVEKARARATQFTWESAAHKTLNVLSACAKQ